MGSIGSVTVTGPQLLVLIVVPVVTLGLWWLLGHTRFGESVRAVGDERRPRAAHRHQPEDDVDRDLDDRRLPLGDLDHPHRDEPDVGAARDDRTRHAARRHDRRAHRPHGVVPEGGARRDRRRGRSRRCIFFNFPNDTGIASFVLFLLVLVLVARMSRTDDTGGESFAFAPRVPAVPERLREMWWVRRMPQLVAAIALVVAIVVPFVDHAVVAPPDVRA